MKLNLKMSGLELNINMLNWITWVTAFYGCGLLEILIVLEAARHQFSVLMAYGLAFAVHVLVMRLMAVWSKSRMVMGCGPH